MPRIRTAAGIVLVIGGCFGIALALMFPLYISERVLVAPVDQYTKTTLTGSGAKYLDTGKLKVIENADIVVTSTVRGVPKSSTDATAVWDYFTVVQDARTEGKIDYHSWRMAFDRHTSELKNCCGSSLDGNTSVRQRGLGVIWPPGNVDKRDYQVFDPNTARTWNAKFAGTQQVSGTTANKYVMQIEPTTITRLKQLPGKLLGMDDKKYDVDRVYRGTVTFFVDARTGVQLDRQQQAVSTLRTVDGVDRLTVADLTVRMDQPSREQAAKTSEDKAGSIRVVQTTGPLAAGAVGIVLFAVGFVLTRGGRKGPRGQHHVTSPASPASPASPEPAQR